MWAIIGENLAETLSFGSAVIVAIVAGYYALRKGREEARAVPYEILAKRIMDYDDLDTRVGRLETENAQIKEERRLDRQYIIEVAPWVDEHRQYALYPPPPPPYWLARFQRQNNQWPTTLEEFGEQ